jgi:hypothetical protein
MCETEFFRPCTFDFLIRQAENILVKSSVYYLIQMFKNVFSFRCCDGKCNNLNSFGLNLQLRKQPLKMKGNLHHLT